MISGANPTFIPILRANTVLTCGRELPASSAAPKIDFVVVIWADPTLTSDYLLSTIES